MNPKVNGSASHETRLFQCLTSTLHKYCGKVEFRNEWLSRVLEMSNRDWSFLWCCDEHSIEISTRQERKRKQRRTISRRKNFLTRQEATRFQIGVALYDKVMRLPFVLYPALARKSSGRQGDGHKQKKRAARRLVSTAGKFILIAVGHQ